MAIPDLLYDPDMDSKEISERLADLDFQMASQINSKIDLIIERGLVVSVSLLGLSVLSARITDPEHVWLVFISWAALGVGAFAGVLAHVNTWRTMTGQLASLRRRLAIAVNQEPPEAMKKEVDANHANVIRIRWWTRVAIVVLYLGLISGLGALLAFAALNIN